MMLQLGQEECEFLRRAGLEAADVPEAGKVVFLKPPPNEDEEDDFSDKMHQSYIELVENAVKRVPGGFVVCGADVVIEDACRTRDRQELPHLGIK